MNTVAPSGVNLPPPKEGRIPGGVSALLAIGSNLGDRGQNIQSALGLLEAEPDIEVLAVSSIFETEPVGGPPQGPYLNAAVEISTRLDPRSLLAVLQRVEASLGRVCGVRNGPREMDLDILLYGDLVTHEPDLEIPHPRMLQRGFVLDPLREIAPRRVHPVTRRSVEDHWRSFHERSQLSGGVA